METYTIAYTTGESVWAGDRYLVVEAYDEIDAINQVNRKLFHDDQKVFKIIFVKLGDCS